MDFIRLSSGCADASELSRFIGRGAINSTDGSSLEMTMYLAAIIDGKNSIAGFSGHLSMNGGGTQFEVPIYLTK